MDMNTVLVEGGPMIQYLPGLEQDGTHLMLDTTLNCDITIGQPKFNYVGYTGKKKVSKPNMWYLQEYWTGQNNTFEFDTYNEAYNYAVKLYAVYLEGELYVTKKFKRL